MSEVDCNRQSVFICGFISGVGCAYSGFFSVMCGIIIGIFIKWSTVFDSDLEYLLNKIRKMFYATKILMKEIPKSEEVSSKQPITKEKNDDRSKDEYKYR